jgi:hypothetical protein
MVKIIETDYTNCVNITPETIKNWVKMCEKDVKNGLPFSNRSSGNSSVVSYSWDNGKTITTIISKDFKERITFKR